jgi:sugar phosphate isomerase/epimerase
VNHTFLTRRALVQLAAGGALSKTISPAAPVRLRYVVSTSMYGVNPITEIVPEVRKTGASYLDIWPKPQGNQRVQIDEMGLDNFISLLRRHNARVGVLSRYDLGPFKLRDEFPVAKKLGATTIVTGSQRSRDLSGEALKTAVKDFAEQMRTHAEEAQSSGVSIAVENHGGALLNTPDSLKWFAEFAPEKGLQIAFAPYHLEQKPAAIASLIEALGNRIGFLYVWQHGKEHEQLPGRGPLDFAPVVAALRKIRYAGWASIFMHSAVNGTAIRPTNAEVTAEIVRARKYIESLG